MRLNIALRKILSRMAAPGNDNCGGMTRRAGRRELRTPNAEATLDLYRGGVDMNFRAACNFAFSRHASLRAPLRSARQPSSLPRTPPPKPGPPRMERSRSADFRFGTGETLPELKLHYLTLGTPHRNAAGHVDNAVLLLHGTGGNAHSLLNPHLFERAVRARRHPRYQEILHHPARRHRPRRKFEAL